MGTVGSNPTSSANRATGARRFSRCLTAGVTLLAVTGRLATRKENHGTRTLDIRQAAARPGQEGQGPRQDGRPPNRREDKLEGGDEPTGSGEVVDQTRLLEQFAALHEDLADGRISLDDFEIRQEEIRAKMVVD